MAYLYMPKSQTLDTSVQQVGWVGWGVGDAGWCVCVERAGGLPLYAHDLNL